MRLATTFNSTSAVAGECEAARLGKRRERMGNRINRRKLVAASSGKLSQRPLVSLCLRSRDRRRVPLPQLTVGYLRNGGRGSWQRDGSYRLPNGWSTQLRLWPLRGALVFRPAA